MAIIQETDNPGDIEKQRQMVKEHIFVAGPVLGGFIIFKNFQLMGSPMGHMNITDGVYLEYVDYTQTSWSADTTTPPGSNNNPPMGGHAISILGWGIQKMKVLDPQNHYRKAVVTNVPYWYCRNSWGTWWGDKGYFKMAMYPYNRLSQVDKIVLVQIPAEQAMHQGGGIILFESGNIITDHTFKKLESKFQKKPKIRPDKFYGTEGSVSEEKVKKKKKLSTLAIILISVGSVILVTIILVLIFVFRKKRKTDFVVRNYPKLQ
jgi:hypothetical protein